MLSFVLALAVRLGPLHGLDGLLEAVLGFREIVFSLVALLLKELELAVPESLVLVIGVDQVLVLALEFHVFHA